MATLDRIEPAYVPWTPSLSGLGLAGDAVEEYVGRHRARGRRSFFATLFYIARHRRR